MIRAAIGLADDDDQPRKSIARLLDRMYEGDPIASGELFLLYHLALRKHATRWLGGRGGQAGAMILIMRAMLRLTASGLRRPAMHEATFALLRHAIRAQMRPDDPASTTLRAIEPDLDRYAWALLWLPRGERKAFALRFDFEFTYTDIANALHLPSAYEARRRVAQAVLHLADIMNGPGSAR